MNRNFNKITKCLEKQQQRNHKNINKVIEIK